LTNTLKDRLTKPVAIHAFFAGFTADHDRLIGARLARSIAEKT
jgi:hypothetical protein